MMDGVGLGIKGSDLYVCLGLQSIGVGVGCKVAISLRSGRGFSCS